MPISLGGLASGIDTSGLIDKLVSAARAPIDQLAAKKTRVDGAVSTIQTFSSKLAALKDAAIALSTSNGFSCFAASSSDAAVVASTSGGATAGTYTVGVTALARAQKCRSAAQGSASTALGTSGTIAVTVGAGPAVNVAVAASDTLSDVAAKISSSGARVSASVVQTNGGYRLLVQGRETGAVNGFTISETGTTLGLDTPASTYETAQDAALEVDQMPITSKSNMVAGVIPGVTLALTKVTTTLASVQVSGDSAALKKKIDAFVSAFNDVVKSGHAAAGFGAVRATNAELAGDRAVRGSLERLARVTGGAVPGASGKYTTLASVGLAFKRDGSLAFDASKLDQALAADAGAVARLFVTDTTTGATGVMKAVAATVDALVTGESSPVQARLDALATTSRRLADKKADMEQQLDRYQKQLQRQFLAMDQVVGRYQSVQGAVAGIGKNEGGGS